MCVAVPACGCVDIELVGAGVGLGREGSGVGDAVHSSVFCIFLLLLSECFHVCASGCPCVCVYVSVPVSVDGFQSFNIYA